VNVRAILRIICIGLFLCTSSIFAQNTVRLKTLNTNDGLNFRHVNSIVQDQRGFMWFGTSQGITKYDGNTFKIFNNSRKNPNFIPYEDILDFEYQSNTNRLWYIANHKLFSLNLDTEELEPIEGVEKELKGEVLDIALDKTNNLWIVLDHPVNNQKTQHLIKYDGKSFQKVKSLMRNSAGFTSIDITKSNRVCWTTINHGLSLFSQDGDFLRQKILDSYDWYGKTIHYRESFFDSKDRHYYCSETKGGVDVYNGFDFEYNLINHPSVFYSAAEDNDGGVWFTGKKAVFYRSPVGDVFDYTAEIGSVLNSSDITSAYVDYSNLLWLSTDNGLIKVKLIPQNFKKLLHRSDAEWGISFRNIFGLKNGDLVAMCETENTLYKINALGETQRINILDGHERFKDARFFVSDTINNRAFTVTNSLIEIDFDTNQLLLFKQFDSFLNETKSNPLTVLKKDSLLMGYTLSRLIRVDQKTKAYKPVFKNKPKNDYILKTLLQSKQNPDIIWVGTRSHGLLKLNLNGKIEAQYDITTSPSLSKNSILSLLEVDNTLFIGTFGGGINVLDLKDNSIQVIDTQIGLCDNNVVSILPAHKDEIIAATYNGLSRIDLKTMDIQNYFEKDGLCNNEFNYTSAYKTRNGEFYFGGLNGITKFSIDKLSQKRELPALNFTKLEMFNQRKDTLIQLTKLGNKPVVLSPYDINLKVDWSVPDYFDESNYTYYTTMEGFENKWFFQGNANSIRYNQLPAGAYNLKIKGVDINGNKSKAGLEIPILVEQVFYKTWWFMVIVMLFISAIIYSLFQYRLQQALALERLRTKISSDLHDDVGSMLTGLAMQTEMLEMQATSKAEKNKLKRLTMLSRNTISHMRDFVWSIDSRKDKLEDLVERIHEHAEECLLPSGIAYDIKIEGTPLSKKLDLNYRRNLFLIYKEAVTNILKHSDAKHVDISITNHKTCCSFKIKDNGNLKSVKVSTGQGLANMKMRSELINAELHFETVDGFGIELVLPQSI